MARVVVGIELVGRSGGGRMRRVDVVVVEDAFVEQDLVLAREVVAVLVDPSVGQEGRIAAHGVGGGDVVGEELPRVARVRPAEDRLSRLVEGHAHAGPG